MPDSAQSSHPGTWQLVAFAQGKLAGAERAALQGHLKGCPACRQALAAGGESASGRDTLATMGAPAGGRDTLATMGAPDPGATTTHHPGSAVPADLANHPRYEVLQMLGQGGMGAVYKARHKKMDRLVALKVINAKLLNNPKAVERFLREVKAAAKLDHPNIVRAHDADEAGGTHFLVMEFVEGTDLAQYVEKKGALPVAHACDLIRQAAIGMEHAHQHGMVHRDIKPHNMMLANPVASAPGAPVVKVMDFGLARLARETASEAALTGENALMGTADYIAPEQAEDAHTADIRADIYSLGCSLFHLLAGRPMLAGASITQKLAAHLTGKLPLGDLPASVPAELRVVLAKMVAKDPAQRYQTPVEVAAALAPFIKKATGVNPPPLPASAAPAGGNPDRNIAAKPSAPARLGKINRRRPLLIGGGMLAAALLAGAVVLWASRDRQPTLEPQRAEAPVTGPKNGKTVKQQSGPPNAETVEQRPGPTNGKTVKQPETPPVPNKNSLGMEFVLVPKGTFWMGGGGGKPVGREWKIEEDFELGVTHVTQAHWQAVMGNNPSYFSREGDGKEEVKNIPDEELKQFPVEQVSWNDAQEFLQKLNEREWGHGGLYRLPTEAEWEYACRGGATSREECSYDFYVGRPSNDLSSLQANFNGNAPAGNAPKGPNLWRPCKVASFAPNGLGLYDMHGNVWEWCADLYQGGPNRVDRGGSWRDGADACRSAERFGLTPVFRINNLGFRLARSSVR